MSEIILCNLSDANQIIETKRTEWVYNILTALNIPEDIIYTNNAEHYRGELIVRGIHIESKNGGEELDIYKLKWHGTEQQGGWLPLDAKYLIAQWKKPKKIRKIEGRDVYYEIHTNDWSMVKLKS